MHNFSYSQSVLHRAVAQIFIAGSLLASAQFVEAAAFTLTAASTSARTLATGESGTITDTGALTVSGSTVAITVTGNNVTINNSGSVKQTGTGRAIRDNTGVQNLTITNGSSTNANATITTADADVIQVNKANTSVSVYNYGSMISYNASSGGAQVIDFNAITSGTNRVYNYTNALMMAYEADAVRTGVNGEVYNYGTIKSITSAGSSDGVDMQSNSGGKIYNYSTGTIEGGRHGITGGQNSASDSFVATIYNAGTIKANNGSGLNFDGYNANQVTTINNSGSIIGTGVTGDGDGVDVDGIVYLTNSGTIRSTNAFSSAGLAYSEGVSVGGGTIDNSGTIEGLVASGNSNAVGRGITLAGNDITSGINAGKREGLYADAIIYNRSGGLIRGDSDSAIYVSGMASGHTVTIHNESGATLRGGGTTHAAVYTGDDNDTIYNAGSIDGSSSNKAIDMGAGNNTLYITGGSASVSGSINGGSGGSNQLIMQIGSGNSFSYSGNISNFSRVEVQSGTVRLAGNNSYTGDTVLSGGVLTLVGNDVISADSALVLSGGTLQLEGTAGSNSQTFASLSLLSSSTIDLGGSMITFSSLGTIDSSSTLTILNAVSNSYGFRLLGDYTGNASFLALLSATTIDGLAVSYAFNGTYTQISVSAVPEAQSWMMVFLGLLLITHIRLRRTNQSH